MQGNELLIIIITAFVVFMGLIIIMSKKFTERRIGDTTVVNNIPMPTPHGELYKAWPFDRMEVGESFAIDTVELKIKAVNASSQFGKRSGMKFSIRKTHGTETAPYRCWRIA